jgi:shikimate kinase
MKKKQQFRPILITGFMGAGKTSAAAALARKLDCPVIDLDNFIREREGRTAQTIIEEEGEARFREIESAALRDVLESGSARVVALGGGTWTIADNRALVREHNGLTIWLDAPFELCWQRMQNEGDALRPLARERESARALYDARLPLYRKAERQIEIDEDKSAEWIAAEIVNTSR